MRYLLLTFIFTLLIGCDKKTHHVEDCIADNREAFKEEALTEQDEVNILLGCQFFKNDSKKFIETVKENRKNRQ